MTIPPTAFVQNKHFEDKVVDNQGFFQAVEEGIPSFLSIAEIRAQTRLDIKKLLAHMKQNTFIQGVKEWTAREQEDFFEKVHSEIVDAGIAASTVIQEKVQTLIVNEIGRKINDTTGQESLHDGSGNTLIPHVGEYQNFLDTSFLIAKETALIPLDLRLTVGSTASIVKAKRKLEKYHGKYNALISVDEKNNPIGVVRASAINEWQKRGHNTLEGIEILPQAFGYYATSSQDLRKIMEEYNINILPIIDSKTNVLIGILTSDSLGKKEIQYYSTTSITRLSLEVGMGMPSHESKKEQS